MTSETEMVKAVRQEMNRLRGKLAGFIEACSLPERQERGIVTTMKSLSYDAEAAILKKLDQ
jgi:hypothetical protein